MRLEYSRAGKQFFFVTLGVAERRPVLSRLVDEKSRPGLTELGEMVKAALRAVHRVWMAVTVSDYIIMPDHIHYLLIVDYDRDKSISPLFVAHRLADAVEMALGLDRTGAHAPAPLNARTAVQDAGSQHRLWPQDRRRQRVGLSADAHPGSRQLRGSLRRQPHSR